MKGEAYFRNLEMLASESDPRLSRPGLGVSAAPPPGEWDWYAQCEREDFVNCSFGARGFCQNVRHASARGWGSE